MKALLLATVISAFRLYVGGGVFDRIVQLVTQIDVESALSGQEKMAALLVFAKGEFATMSSTLIRAVVELALIRLKGIGIDTFQSGK
jgi:hypothetical protein